MGYKLITFLLGTSGPSFMINRLRTVFYASSNSARAGLYS